MSDSVSRKALLESLKKELEVCTKEKFNEKKTRFYLGRETVLTDLIGQIESGRFNIPSTESEGKIESLKAITELAVKGLGYYANKNNYGTENLSTHGFIPIDDDGGLMARTTLEVIMQRLSHIQEGEK
jgi:flagellar basal body rod protein FlgG